MPVTGGAGDISEVKDSQANVAEYISAAGELVAQYGICFDSTPFPVTGSGAVTVPASASWVEVGAITGAVTLTLPAAGAVTPGRAMMITDGNGSISSSATVALKTATSASGKIGGVAAGSASTSAAAYAFINAAYGAVRLMSDGTNWSPF